VKSCSHWQVANKPLLFPVKTSKTIGRAAAKVASGESVLSVKCNRGNSNARPPAVVVRALQAAAPVRMGGRTFAPNGKAAESISSSSYERVVGFSVVQHLILLSRFHKECLAIRRKTTV
jgi:hypothetical protein